MGLVELVWPDLEARSGFGGTFSVGWGLATLLPCGEVREVWWGGLAIGAP